jgi:hypothetical protein
VDRGGFAQVGGHRPHPLGPCGLVEFLRRRLELLLAAADDHHIRAFGGQGACDRPPDAGAAAGNNREPVHGISLP